jgi:hypothetical protein
VQHVHVRQAGKRRVEPVEQVARFDERQVERLAVVVTTVPPAPASSAIAPSIERSTIGFDIRYWRTRNEPPSNHAQPTRNA